MRSFAVWFPLLGALFALLLGGCRAEVGGIDRCEGCNVVFVLVDTLRADHLASYGYRRITSPALDRFGREGVQFLQARSQAACTFPSVNSLLTSRYPSRFVDPATQPAIPDDVPTLPRILAGQGYATAAISASPIVRKNPSAHNPVGGYGQGFEVFDETVLWRDATEVSRVADRTMGELREPFFLYVHYMDPHDPYVPGHGGEGVFARPYRGGHDFVAAGDANPVEAMVREGGLEQLSPADLEQLVDRYDESILTFDAGFERLRRALDRRDLAGRTLVVVVADHGEAFLEHGTMKHCHGLFDPEIRVPLFLAGPGLRPGTVEAAVENVDLLPTILDLLGLPLVGPSFEGQSLVPLLEGEEAPGRSYSAMGALRSVNDARHKLLHDLEDGSFRLFDLAADPGETREVTGERGRFHELRRDLEIWLETTEGETSVEERLRRAREVDESLRALGYLG